MGTVVEMLGPRRGQMLDMQHGGDGTAHLPYLVPTRGLLGFRYQFLTATRGTGIMHTHVPRLPAAGRRDGTRDARLAGGLGTGHGAPTYGLKNAEDAGTLFIGPGVEVYEGMVVASTSGRRSDGQRVQEEAPDQHALVEPRTSRCA